MEVPLIAYRDVDVTIDDNVVLKDVSFDVNRGDFVYLMGKVGSGKSSLLKTIYAEFQICETEEPSGEPVARVFDYDLLHIKRKNVQDLRRQLGIVFQDFRLLTDRSVHDNLRFVLEATGWTDREEIIQRIRQVLEQVGMDSKGYKMPHELSGGEQQRVVIARALLNRPDIILADEPTGNLDPETGDAIVQLLHDICRQGTTILMTTHNPLFPTKYPGRQWICDNHRLSENNIDS